MNVLEAGHRPALNINQREDALGVVLCSHFSTHHCIAAVIRENRRRAVRVAYRYLDSFIALLHNNQLVSVKNVHSPFDISIFLYEKRLAGNDPHFIAFACLGSTVCEQVNGCDFSNLNPGSDPFTVGVGETSVLVLESKARARRVLINAYIFYLT